MQQAVRDLLDLTAELSERDFSTIEKALPILDRLTQPISEDDVRGLISVLPADGDPAAGLNWTILHAIEDCPEWPMWELLNSSTPHEWLETLMVRLENGGYERPGANSAR